MFLRGRGTGARNLTLEAGTTMSRALPSWTSFRPRARDARALWFRPCAMPPVGRIAAPPRGTPRSRVMEMPGLLRLLARAPAPKHIKNRDGAPYVRRRLDGPLVAPA